MVEVSLFIPCIVNFLLPDIGEATAALLHRLGCDVRYHEDQTCCGLVPYNGGFRTEARRLARHFIEVFGEDEVIVCPSGSCVNMVKNQYPDLFYEDLRWLERAESLGARTHELSAFIVDILGVEDVGAAYSGKVAYHESCNLLHGLGVSEQPKKLIQSVRGTQLVPMTRADACCGFGGEFSNAYSEISEAMVAEKVKNYLDSGADLLLLCEPGCLLNICGYLSRTHPEKKAMHLANFLVENATASQTTPI
jgi:L-lactate dehydrogenase complex protein LldE